MRLIPACVLLVVATSFVAERPNSAIERFRTLQTALQKSHSASDWHSNLIAAGELRVLLNDNPNSLLEVARAEARTGDFHAAFRDLKQFVQIGQSSDLPTRSPDFAALRDQPEFAKIQSAMEANRKQISLASTAFLLPDANLIAEDIDYDPAGHRFLVTSVREKKIVLISASTGQIEDFGQAPDDWPIQAIKIDRLRGLVWATEAAIQGYKFAHESDWGRSALLCYNLNSRKLLRRIEGPRGSALGDMTLTADGDVVISEGDGGGIYFLSAKGTTLERLDKGDFISPQTPAIDPTGKRVFVPDYLRGIAVLDLATKNVRWLSTDGRFALNGIDGLYFDRGRLIAVQNGTSPERVVSFTLDATQTRITTETVLERSTATLGDPTHGVLVGKDFYYIANSGWDTIDEHGETKAGAHPTAPCIMRIQSVGGETP